MKCLDKFNYKMKLSGKSLRNEQILNSRKLLEETFTDDASSQKGFYFWRLGLKTYRDQCPLKIRLYKRAFSSANGNTVKFQTLFNTPIVVGDILFDSKNNRYWICTESFNIDDIHWQGKLTLCNWILKWQNKQGIILEYPCYDINSTQYNSGESFNRQLTIGSSQHMVTLPCDENTVTLRSPQRFFLDKDIENPTSFIVTQNDTTSYNYGTKGLVKVTLFECASNNNTDRPDLGICDYVEIAREADDNLNNDKISKSVISYDTKIIKSGGDSQTFVGTFFDGNGKEITDITPKWIVVCGFLHALNITENGNQICIGIDDDLYVDEEIKLIFSDINNNYGSSIIVKVGSLL